MRSQRFALLAVLSLLWNPVAGMASSGVPAGDDATQMVAPRDGGAEARPSDDAPQCAKEGEKPKLFSPAAKPYGRSHDEWGQTWIQWAYATNLQATLDPTGELCSISQFGPVWLLAGGLGPSSEVHRTCEIPCDRAIFFPITVRQYENIWIGEPVRTIEELRQICEIPELSRIGVELDGKPLKANFEKHRVQSEPFAYNLLAGNIFGQPAGIYFPSVSEAFWVMLAPLPPGEHQLHVFFTTVSGSTRDVYYDLHVKSLELLCSSPPCP